VIAPIAPTEPAQPPDSAPGRWRALALLAFAELLGMSLWFAGSAAAPQLRERWALSGAEVGWLTTAVQLGFVAGTALSALLNLADIVPARRLFAFSAGLGAFCNAWLAVADGLPLAIASRFLSGACLAGVYPPAMKMAATWFRARRGLAVGTIVGALTVGKAGPYLVTAIPGADAAFITLLASASATAAAALVLVGYRDGPFAFGVRPFSWALVGQVARGGRWRLATGGYLGHMAELYSYWTWIPAFVAASTLGDPHALTAAATPVAQVLAFAVIAVGGLGCIWGGLVADRIGRAALVIRAMAVSGLCCALVGLAFGRSLWLLAPAALIWGFFIIADSAQFSVLVTESVAPHAVGTALTLQVSLGFLLTTATIQVIPPIVRTAGWPWAFVLLSLGPLLGILSIRRLQRAAVPSLSPGVTLQSSNRGSVP
jgi:MFS family permease